MRIVSFAWTTPALLAAPDPLAKTCTRREWAQMTRDGLHAGDYVQAWDKNPRVHGIKVGIIRLTETPYLQRMGLAPATDYTAEGFEWIDKHPDVRARVLHKVAKEMRIRYDPGSPLSMRMLWGLWVAHPQQVLTVVRFEPVELLMPLDQWMEERAPIVLG